MSLRMLTVELPAADLKNFDADRMIQWVSDMGANAIVLFANSYVDGYVFYRSKIGKLHPDLAGRDLFGELCVKAKQKGLQVIAYLNAKFTGKYFLEQYPDIQMQTPDGRLLGTGDTVMACPESNFKQLFLHQLQEVVDNYDIDGVYIDELSFQAWCVCKNCQEHFSQTCGESLPVHPEEQDWDSTRWRRFVEWRFSSIKNFAQLIYETIKKRKPHVKVFFQGAFPMAAAEFQPFMMWRTSPECSGWYLPAVYGQGQQIYTMEDILAYEDYRSLVDLPIWWIGATLRYGKALAPCKERTVLLEYPPLPWLLLSLSRTELELLCFETIANHGSPWFAIYAPGIASEEGWDSVRKAFNFLRNNPDFTSLKLDSPVAIVFSESTAIYYGQNQVGSRYLEEFYGWYEMLLKLHIESDVIPSTVLKSGAQLPYKVIVLPNVALLNEEEVQGVLNFIASGGSLISTFEAGIYSGNLEKRTTPLMAKLGLAIPSGDSVYAGAGYLKRASEQDVFRDINLTPVFGTVKGVEELGVDCRCLATFVPVSENMFAPPETASQMPGLILREMGKSKVFWFTCEIGKTFYHTKSSQIERLVGNIFEFIGVKPIVSVEGPGAEHLEVVRAHDEAGNKVVVSLLNHGSFSNRYGQIFSVVPLTNLTVEVEVVSCPREVKSLVSGRTFNFDFNSGLAKIKIDNLEIFECLEIKL